MLMVFAVNIKPLILSFVIVIEMFRRLEISLGYRNQIWQKYHVFRSNKEVFDIPENLIVHSWARRAKNVFQFKKSSTSAENRFLYYF